MAILRKSLVLVLLVVCGASGYAAQSEDASSRTNLVAFLHATVIPMDEERFLPDHTVLTANGTIVEIGPTTEVEVPSDALHVDATGRYLIPALCDMHVHLLSDAWNLMLRPEVQSENEDVPFESFLFPYVANGVTTVQALSATPQEIVLRHRIDQGELIAPRLILARMIDGPDKAWPPPLSTWVATAEEAGGAVHRSKKEGYDKIKVYSFLSRESYDAIISTAGELDMDVIGHIPMSLSLDYVLEAGQKMIAHSEEVAKHAGGDHSAEHIDDIAEKMAAKGVWMAPTLVTTRSILELLDDPDELLTRPEAAYFAHPMEQGVWSFIVENLYRPIPEAAREKLRNDFETFQKPLTRVFHHKGGGLLTGTDSLLPGLVPGFALQRELRELVAVGMTPFDALRTSTTAPFEYLGEIDTRGTIEVGRNTDLLLLDENPLEDIAATSAIRGVLIRGRWIGSEEIEARMQEIERSFEAARVSLPRQ